MESILDITRTSCWQCTLQLTCYHYHFTLGMLNIPRMLKNYISVFYKGNIFVRKRFGIYFWHVLKFLVLSSVVCEVAILGLFYERIPSYKRWIRFIKFKSTIAVPQDTQCCVWHWRKGFAYQAHTTIIVNGGCWINSISLCANGSVFVLNRTKQNFIS